MKDNYDGEITSFRDEYFYLSNFYPCIIKDYEGNTFHCSEAMFQSYKTLDPEERKQFCSMDGRQAKRRGKQVQLRSDWENIKFEVMRYCVMQKFLQNRDIAVKLISTGQAKLIEGNNWHDKYWGAVLKRVPVGDKEVECWDGQNRLGLILHQTRRLMFEQITSNRNGLTLNVPLREYMEMQDSYIQKLQARGKLHLEGVGEFKFADDIIRKHVTELPGDTEENFFTPEAAANIADRYGMIDGEHHKQWVIDQMLFRILGDEGYRRWLEKTNRSRLEDGDYPWDPGIAP